MDILVSTGWLADQLGADDLRILHCSVQLRPKPEGGGFVAENTEATWAEAHIPGSSHIDLGGELSDPTSNLRFMVPDAATFAASLERHGVGDGTRVVLYDNAANMWAARIWWMMRHFGFHDAAVLDGGWRSWQADGLDSSNGHAPTYDGATLTLRDPVAGFTDRDEVLTVATEGGSACLLDALGDEQFRGVTNAYGRPGHIPGAVNVAAMNLVDADTHRYLPLPDLRAKFGAVGDDPERRIVAYCGGGIAASSDAFVLSLLGYRNVAVYDASLSEWAADPSLPLEVTP